MYTSVGPPKRWCSGPIMWGRTVLGLELSYTTVAAEGAAGSVCAYVSRLYLHEKCATTDPTAAVPIRLESGLIYW